MKNKKVLIALVIGLMLSVATPSFAKTNISSLMKQIIQLQKENALLKSQIKSLKTNIATPLSSKISYQGTTFSNSLIKYKGVNYVKVSTIGSLLNLPINYSRNDNTYYMGYYSPGVYMSDIMRAYTGGDDNPNDGFSIAGVKYSKGFKYGYNYADGYNNAFYYNLNGKYTTISGLLGIETGAESDDTVDVSFYGDDQLLETVHINATDLATPVSISVKDIKVLKVEINASKHWLNSGYLDFVNAKIY